MLREAQHENTPPPRAPGFYVRSNGHLKFLIIRVAMLRLDKTVSTTSRVGHR